MRLAGTQLNGIFTDLLHLPEQRRHLLLEKEQIHETQIDCCERVLAGNYSTCRHGPITPKG